MSWQMPEAPYEDFGPDAALETVVVPRTRDLGDGFHVLRALPSVHRRMVGPFIFFDQMGPGLFTAGKGLDVRPHPHIGLATVTYLFEGTIRHRDSLGTVADITPGAVNWMTAGRGIAHSERTPPDARAKDGTLFGIQLWVALPKALEDVAPSFAHTPASAIPELSNAGVRARVILGQQFGKRSPVHTHSEMFYVDVTLEPGAALPLDALHEERAVFIAKGELEVDGRAHGAGQLLIARPRAALTLRAKTAARVLLLGGEPLDGPRHIYWNFVASSPERIEQAKADWRAERFPVVPEETERIPLPEEPAGRSALPVALRSRGASGPTAMGRRATNPRAQARAP